MPAQAANFQFQHRARGSQQTRLAWNEESRARSAILNSAKRIPLGRLSGKHPGQHRGARPTIPKTILRSSIAEHPPDKRKTAAQYRAEGPFPGDVKAACPSVKRVVLVRVQAWEPWAIRFLPTSSIGVSASIAAFHAAEAGAAPAWSIIFSTLPRCKSSACRLAKAEVRGASPRGSTIFHSRCSPMQRQRAQTSFSAGASPATGTMEREPAERAGFPC